MSSANNVIQVIINGKNNAMPAFKSATQMIARFGAASVAALSAAAVRAGQFEKGMAEISTLLDGDVTPSIERMRSEVLQLSVEFGQTMGKMTKARYDIISAGFTDAADSAAVLTAANKLAVAGVSDVAKTADLLTTALNGMGKSASEAEAVSDILFQTVRKGKTTISELAAAFGPVFASARVAGVGLEELGGVMATITAAGIDTAEGATALSNLLRSLAAPTGEAKGALADLGITLDNGLVPALQRLSTVSAEGLDALSRVIPNIRALKAAAVAASDIDKLNSNLDAMANAAGVTEEAFRKMSKTFDFQSKQARAALDALVIEVGTAVLPIFTDLVGKVRDAAVIFSFMVFKSDLAKTALRELAAVAKIEVVAAFVSMVNSIFSIINPLISQVQKLTKTLVVSLGGYFDVMSGATQKGDIGRLIRGAQADLINFGGTLEGIKRTGLVDLETVLAGVNAGFAKLSAGAGDAGLIISGTLGPSIKIARRELAKIQAMMDAAQRATKPASDIISSGFGVDSGAGGGGQVFGPESPTVIPDETATKDQVDTLKEQVADLAKFTAEDFANMAFSIGDAFATVATDIGAHMLGLTKGPLMLGRAFKQMAAGILGDIARIIARLLVAKALMSAFGGGGIIGGVAQGLGLFSTGGTIPQAAFGMGVPGSGMSMPAMVVPGSPGLDRSPVMAHGGEVLVPRQTVDAIDRSRKRARTAPPPARRNSRGSGSATVNVQAYRPFRREEQTLLRDSVVEGLERAERYRG